MALDECHIYPNSEQSVLIEKYFGYAWFTYNAM
ncbi:helix-turn-helix domain-containing protein [Acinetobacter sichuanensis]|uniref:Helix-turn-helix domain-containing protein n=1 Tax=Acinetobacter sichuanensis TaxID=2136183 RepID=A0A371YR60_9GAMM|nr:hypothetical protein C9E89_008730 [Acinetobacter sichuanensis]